eukprot:GEMP01088037.1.p1 GENE.GEMP01088037.1~~GEMP01088037.1.p1  ORF type:complete len:147 (+),score=48.64 GEMP01088037.1:121-561(+)
MATTTINETNNTYINKLSSTMGRMVELSSNHITSWSTFLLPNQELFLSIKDKALDHAASIDTKFGFWQKLEQLAEGALVKGRVMMKNGKIQGAISYAQHLDHKVLDGKIHTLCGKGRGMLEIGTAYMVREMEAARQRKKADVSAAS